MTLYIIEDSVSGQVKIGYTGGEPKKRMRALQTGNPNSLVLIKVVPGSKKDEKQVHKFLANYRTNGEWFVKEGLVIEFINELGKPSSKKTTYNYGVRFDKKGCLGFLFGNIF